jgi:hypothetical protein
MSLSSSTSLINFMKIHFFTPQDNKKSTALHGNKNSFSFKGSVSRSGMLMFPPKALDQLGLNPQATRFRIGTPIGKRAAKVLYVVTAPESTTDAFMLVKATNRYRLPLAGILQQIGIDFRTSPYRFMLMPVPFEDGLTGYVLAFTGGEAPKPKVPYTGKPRGRKPKVRL